MFLRVYDVTYVEIQSNHSKLRNLASSRKMVRNHIKLNRTFFLHTTNRNPEKTKGETFCTSTSMTSLLLNSKFVIL